MLDLSVTHSESRFRVPLGFDAYADYNNTTIGSEQSVNNLLPNRDELDVVFEPNVVPRDQVEFVLKAGTNITQDKELVLVEGPAAGTGRWTLTTSRNQTISSKGLYNYQLPGGHLEFRKGSVNSGVEVSRVPVDLIKPGTRLTFTWLRD